MFINTKLYDIEDYVKKYINFMMMEKSHIVVNIGVR